MQENKTKKTEISVEAFLRTFSDEALVRDCESIVKMMQSVSKSEAKMWGSAIIGFGDVHYKYASGREADWIRVGYSPRKQQISLYIMGAVRNEDMLAMLGKYKTGKGCLYIKKLSDIDDKILSQLIKYSCDNAEKILNGK